MEEEGDQDQIYKSIVREGGGGGLPGIPVFSWFRGLGVLFVAFRVSGFYGVVSEEEGRELGVDGKGAEEAAAGRVDGVGEGPGQGQIQVILTGMPALLARSTMSLVPPESGSLGKARMRSGLPSESMRWFRRGPAALPSLFQSAG
jgi:hypothetical protein